MLCDLGFREDDEPGEDLPAPLNDLLDSDLGELDVCVRARKRASLLIRCAADRVDWYARSGEEYPLWYVMKEEAEPYFTEALRVLENTPVYASRADRWLERWRRCVPEESPTEEDDDYAFNKWDHLSAFLLDMSNRIFERIDESVRAETPAQSDTTLETSQKRGVHSCEASDPQGENSVRDASLKSTAESQDRTTQLRQKLPDVPWDTFNAPYIKWQEAAKLAGFKAERSGVPSGDAMRKAAHRRLEDGAEPSLAVLAATKCPDGPRRGCPSQAAVLWYKSFREQRAARLRRAASSEPAAAPP
jgi:hypothetical protein